MSGVWKALALLGFIFAITANFKVSDVEYAVYKLDRRISQLTSATREGE